MRRERQPIMCGMIRCFVILIVCAVYRTKCWTERTKSFQDLTCAQVANRIRIDKIVGLSPKLSDITGQWVSEKCEIRAGPEFLLRKYIIYPSGRFQLFQFYFSDPDCHEPAFCIEARGRFGRGSYRRSWTIQGATEADFEIMNVAVIAYTTEVAQALQRTVNGTCTTSGGRSRKPGSIDHRHRNHHVRHHDHLEGGDDAYVWQPWERYDLFSDVFEEPFTTDIKAKKKKKKMLPNADTGKDDDADDRVKNTIESHSFGNKFVEKESNGFQSAPDETTFENYGVDWEDISSRHARGGECPPSSTLELSFNELQLMRVEVRVTATAAGPGVHGNTPGIGPPSTKRLYLGDVHTDNRQRSAYRPRAYQDPLVAEDAQEAVSRCRVCRTVSESSDYYPPSLPLPAPTGHFPSISQLLSDSSWTSDRCETRPYGIFLTRRLAFGTSLVSHSSKSTGMHHHHEPGPVEASGVVGRDWWDERVQYFTDPACRNPYFAVYGRGRYAIGNPVPAYGRDVAYEADFDVTQLKVTVNDKRLLPVVKNCGGRRPTKGTTEVNEAVRNHEMPTAGTDKWLLGVEMDVTVFGGCPALDVRMPTSSIPQLLAVVRRGGPGPNDVVLLVGQEPMEPIDNSFHEDDAERQRRRPTSFNPGLRRCIDANRPSSATKSLGLSDFTLGATKLSSAGSRRPWRHVASSSSSSSSSSINDVTIISCSIALVLTLQMAGKVYIGEVVVKTST